MRMHRHPFDPISFVAGAIFLGLGLASLVGVDLDPDKLRWLVPIVLILLGLTLLLPLRPTSRNRGEKGP
ncbi:MAG: hypothetical protein ABR592_12450 [Nitriliruptorales bacterium]